MSCNADDDDWVAGIRPFLFLFFSLLPLFPCADTTASAGASANTGEMLCHRNFDSLPRILFLSPAVVEFMSVALVRGLLPPALFTPPPPLHCCNLHTWEISFLCSLHELSVPESHKQQGSCNAPPHLLSVEHLSVHCSVWSRAQKFF